MSWIRIADGPFVSLDGPRLAPCVSLGDVAEHARERFEVLAADVVEPVRRFLARRTDPDTAEDVLAETLLVCWRRIDQVPDHALPWVYGVARNCLANAERSERRQRRVAGRIRAIDPPEPSTRPVEEPDPRVAEALAVLRPQEAELLRLWAWEQLGAGEIAVALALTPTAASLRLYRARAKFVEALRKIDAGAGHEGGRQGKTGSEEGRQS